MSPKIKRHKNVKDISLRDVVMHMTGMEQRLSRGIETNTKEIAAVEQRLSAKIETNTRAIQDVKETLTRRIDALEEDLTATILDTVKIRQHVGMPVPSEE